MAPSASARCLPSVAATPLAILPPTPLAILPPMRGIEPLDDGLEASPPTVASVAHRPPRARARPRRKRPRRKRPRRAAPQTAPAWAAGWARALVRARELERVRGL